MRLIILDKKQFIEFLRSAQRPIVICGASFIGEYVYQYCLKESIDITAFCDNDPDKETYCGKDVINPEMVGEKYGHPIVLMTIGYAQPVMNQMERQGIDKIYSPVALLETYAEKLEHMGKYSEEKYMVNRFIWLQNHLYRLEDPVIINSLDFIITEKCSQKCKDCCNLMQYYQNPRNILVAQLKREINALFRYVDLVSEIKLIGGEPFMHPDWHDIVAFLVNLSQIRWIWIFTNGTITPDKRYAELLKHYKIILQISDYGSINRSRLRKTIGFFDEHHIEYNLTSYTQWLDCSKIKNYRRSKQKNQQIFEQCCVTNVTTYTDGKLFRCPFAANAYRLKALPDSSDGYCEIVNCDYDDIRSKIYPFLYSMSAIPACGICPGRNPQVSKTIPAAVQTSQPLAYKKYE